MTAEQDQLLKSAFSLLDFDGDGKLGEDEFRTLLRCVLRTKDSRFWRVFCSFDMLLTPLILNVLGDMQAFTYGRMIGLWNIVKDRLRVEAINGALINR